MDWGVADYESKRTGESGELESEQQTTNPPKKCFIAQKTKLYFTKESKTKLTTKLKSLNRKYQFSS